MAFVTTLAVVLSRTSTFYRRHMCSGVFVLGGHPSMNNSQAGVAAGDGWSAACTFDWGL